MFDAMKRILILLLLGLAGCQMAGHATKNPVSAEVYERWRKDNSYYALIEIIDVHLDRPDWSRATKQDVLKHLGKPNWQTINQDPEREWGYQGMRHVPYQNKAIFEFNDQGELIEIYWLSE